VFLIFLLPLIRQYVVYELPLQRHPERNISRTLRDVESKDPEDLYITSAVRAFSTYGAMGRSSKNLVVKVVSFACNF
jgi:hypothetical protein